MPRRPLPRAPHSAMLAALLAVTAAGTLAFVVALFPDLRGAGLWSGAAAMALGSLAVGVTRPVYAAPAVAACACFLVLGPWAEATEAGATIWVAVAVSLVAAAAAQTAADRREVVVAFVPFAVFAVATAASAQSVLGALGALSPVLGGSTFGLWMRLRAAHRERKALAERQARADERLELAAQLHDLATARLTRIVIAARDAGAPGIEADAQAALGDLRRVVVGLRTAEAPRESLAADGSTPPGDVDHAVREMVIRARDAGQQVSLSGGVGTALPRATADCLTRVVEEGLTNARKHAAGAPVTVQVSDHSVEVSNPAAHPDASLADTGSGTGLTGLAARTALVGGTLRHGRSVDGGWALVADFRTEAGR
ncbi:sensor histidine kinase [Tsukamurella sp. 1534]|uniref:sensor histidine kinase n=1 Tax=Tsukamurella sp. 1534 TaxID=1151061 RepID=UPI00031F9D1A|nr:hypothetical protein [Tsukamurella sp. 1534]